MSGGAMKLHGPQWFANTYKAAFVPSSWRAVHQLSLSQEFLHAGVDPQWPIMMEDVRDLSVKAAPATGFSTALASATPEDIVGALHGHIRASERDSDRLEQLWALLDNAVDLLEAKMRFLMLESQQSPPIEQNDWVSEKLNGVSGIDTVLRSARGLLRTLSQTSAITADDVEADEASNGCVKLTFQGGVSWLVGHPRLPWPAVSVRLYLPAGPDTPRFVTHSCHLASSVVSLSKRSLQSETDLLEDGS